MIMLDMPKVLCLMITLSGVTLNVLSSYLQTPDIELSFSMDINHFPEFLCDPYVKPIYSMLPSQNCCIIIDT